MARSGAEAAAEAPRGGVRGGKAPPENFFAILAVCSHLPSQVWSKGKLQNHRNTCPDLGVLRSDSVRPDRVLMCYHLCKVGELVVLQKACVNNLWKLVC